MTPEQIENARELIKALRSGTYRQTTMKLCRDTPEGISYCCLGVACEIAMKKKKKKNIPLVKEKYGPMYRYTDEEGHNIRSYTESLPPSVMDLFGFKDTAGRYILNAKLSSLAEQNDSGKSFEEIANLIEQALNKEMDMFV